MTVAPYRVAVALVGDTIEVTLPGDVSAREHTLRFTNDLLGCRMLLRILHERAFSHSRNAKHRIGEASQLTQAQADEIIRAWTAGRPAPPEAAKVAEADEFLKELGL